MENVNATCQTKYIKWLEHIGLCEGVRNAIWSAVISVSADKKVLIIGNLIHNQRVQYELSWNGIETVYDICDIPSQSRVIIPAHGITREAEQQLKEITEDIIDRTCPVVIKLRRLLMSVARQHFHVVLVGKKNHPEIVGAVSYVPKGQVSIVETLDQVKSLDLPTGNIALLSQTTASSSVFHEIMLYLQETAGIRLSVFETICPTVIKRQQDAKAFAQQSDLVFVAGDSKSSNTFSLFELAKSVNSYSYLIPSDQVKPFDSDVVQKLNKACTIAILSGTSSPTYIIDETLYRIKRSIDGIKQDKAPVLAIFGPTAVGKTAIAEVAAHCMKGEIINVDSMQIYQHLTIGTAKPLIDSSSPPYHMVDFMDPKEHFSVAKFRTLTHKTLEEIHQRKTLAILAGGSNLYLSSIVDGLFELDESIDPLVRETLRQQKEMEGLSSMYRQLQLLDKVTATKIHPNDEKRILRSLEVILSTQRCMSDLQKDHTRPLPYFFIKIGLIRSPEQLYQSIDQRVEEMLQKGLMNEITCLLEQGYASALEKIKAHGYRELIQACLGQISFDEAIALMKKNTRNYAKRQLSWLRQRSDFHLLNISMKKPSEWAKIISEIYEKIAQNIVI